MGLIYLFEKLMGIKNTLKSVLHTKYFCSGIVLFFVGLGMLCIGYVIRDNKWGKYGWAMVIGVLLLGGSFLLFLWSLMRKMDYQSLKEERHQKTQNKNPDQKIN